MSNGLLFLTSEDFNLQRGKKGNILCHNIPGYSLVLFYSNTCVYCDQLLPIFKRLPGSIGGCQFGIINVSKSGNVVKMAKDSITPITYVPYIVLYIEGKPFMVYKGPSDDEQIRKFVIEVANNVQKKQSFSKEKVKEEVNTGIPEYSIGKPVCGTDNRCYLSWDELIKKTVV